MSDEESPKQVNVDPRCIQEALRMYLQPIKNDDPQLDFYTMYRRETMEYDTEYMNKYNEDLNTTLIFAGLFSAVSSAFVIAIQPELQPDPGQQSEAYLRAILLTLNPSISPDEPPAAPPVWSGPPQEIITTLDLLYASLLMSLLAAFVAMLGKQWLNRYLRHAGGSVIERCGDRQRKFDGLEKWPFRLFIESLPIMLQIALFLLASGLSRYVWSINTSVSAVIISLTVLGFLFYIVIVVIGTSSYDCPFQTPLSITLRGVLPLFSASNLNSFICATQKNARNLLQNLPQPIAPSLIYAAWMDTRQELVSTLRRAYQAIRSHSSLNILPSHIVSHVRGQVERFGHRIIVPFLPIYRMFGRAKQRLAQTLRGFRRATILPVASGDTIVQRPVRQNGTGTGLRIHVRNFETLRRQNTDNARCVCWVLRNITDPEAIDAAIRLAGNIRWFDGNSKHDPPFDLIVSIFEACFDSTGEVYPGTRDRAYFSARAILQIHAMARIQSEDYALRYPISTVFPGSVRPADPDLRNVLEMLKSNARESRPTLHFPVVKPHTHAHLLWMSNLFLDLTRVGPNPYLRNYGSYLGVAASGHQAAIANTLIVWYMLLGGCVEEETFWATDKSDSLEPILSLLAPRVENVIADWRGHKHLDCLLEFLAAWDKRPILLTPLVYRWCSALFEVVVRANGSAERPGPWGGVGPNLPGGGFYFLGVGLYYDGFRPGGASRCSHRYPLVWKDCTDRLFWILEIGFRQVYHNHRGLPLHLDQASQFDQMVSTIFSSDDDETIADAVCIWIVGGDGVPPGSLARYLARLVERARPFSPRLRQVAIRVMERIGRELEASGLETIRLLNRLKVDVDEISHKPEWLGILIFAIRSPAGVESLSSHWWRLLDKLIKYNWLIPQNSTRDVEVMMSLEEAGDLENLESWIVVMWRGNPTTSIEDIERVTLKLLLHHPSALPRFEDLCNTNKVWDKKLLQRICDKARAEPLPLKCPPRPQSIDTTPLTSLHFGGDDTF